MSLQQAAKHLERHGRNGDDMLVHMSKGEVKSLNDIAMAGGGHLTINPHTGLPEASFLKRMLPMVIGAGLAATGVGAPVAALMVGGGYAAATGDIKKGLMAGLGAYGGAGIGSALATSGAAATQAATPAVSLAEGAAATPPAPIPQTPLTNSITPTIPDAAQSVVVKPNLVNNYGYAPQPGPNIMTGNAPIPANSAASNFRNTGSQMFEGVKSLGSEPGRAAFMKNLEAVPGTFGAKTTLGAAALPLLMPDEQKQEETPVDSDPGQQYTYQANATTPTPTPDPYGREQKYYNQRYVPRAADGGFVKGVLERIGAAGGGGQSGMPEGYSYDANTQQYTKMASGGISDAGYNLGGYSDGGRLLRGPGDGVSDSIPAVIGKKQPARLADGEFVIPARIVSELGNGSTEAGARKLYAMMDRIQKARGKTVGKGKVAKNSRSEKHLPA
jgi:hypothetical protein